MHLAAADREFLSLNLVPQLHRDAVEQVIEKGLRERSSAWPKQGRKQWLISAVNELMNNFTLHLPGGYYRSLPSEKKLQKKLDEVIRTRGFDAEKWSKEFDPIPKEITRRLNDPALIKRPMNRLIMRSHRKKFELWPLFLEMLKHFESHRELTS